MHAPEAHDQVLWSLQGAAARRRSGLPLGVAPINMPAQRVPCLAAKTLTWGHYQGLWGGANALGSAWVWIGEGVRSELRRGKKEVVVLLVKWKGSNAMNATWEEYHQFYATISSVRPRRLGQTKGGGISCIFPLLFPDSPQHNPRIW